MQYFKDLKSYLGPNLGYTSIKIAGGFGTILAISLTTQYYMKWRKRRKITRIIDTFEEFQNGKAYIKNPDQLEDKVCQFIKGGSSKLQILADFDMFLLPEVHSELINKNNGLSMNHVQNEINYDGIKVPEERYFPPKFDYPEEIVKPICNSTMENGKVLHHHSNESSRPLEPILRKGGNTYLETILNHRVPLLLFTDYEEFVKKSVPCITSYPDIYSILSRSLKKKYLSEDNSSKRPNIILVGNMSRPDWMNNESTTVLHIGFLEEEVDFGLLDYFAKYDIVITSEPYLDVMNAFLQRVV